MPLFEAHLPVLCNITYAAIIWPPVMWPLQVVLINDSFLIASHWVEGKWMNHYLGSCMSDQSSLVFVFCRNCWLLLSFTKLQFPVTIILSVLWFWHVCFLMNSFQIRKKQTNTDVPFPTEGSWMSDITRTLMNLSFTSDWGKGLLLFLNNVF